MKFRIEFKKSVIKESKKIPKFEIKRIRTEIVKLTDDPYPLQSKKLRDFEGYYRLRVGKYRVVYRIDNGIFVVFIIRIAHRKKVYKNLK